MPKIDFANLNTPEAWESALNLLISEATTAKENNNSGKRLEIQALLTTFIEKSPAALDFLDERASKVARELFENQVAASFDALAARDAELKKAISDLKTATDAANKKADSIEFKNAIAALNKAKSAVETLKKLQDNLELPDQNLINRIQALTSAISDLQDLIDESEEEGA